MLPVEELDKKDYSEILQEAIKNIPRFTKEWTDFSEHDPGITILEMLTWLTDMQRYYLNRVTEKNKLKFLRLYGVNLDNQKNSISYVELKSQRDNVILPKGTKLKADEQIFEASQSMLIINNAIKKVITATEFLETDNTHVILNKNIVFYPFDKDLKDGNKMYIAFDRKIPVNKKINIFFDVQDDYAVNINESDKIDYHIDFKWMSYSEDGKWNPVEIVVDETCSLIKRGNITIKIKKEMELYDFFSDGNKMYWICVEATNIGVNLSPKLRTIAINYVPVENKNTLVRYKDFIRKDKNYFYNNIYLTGEITIQFKTKFGYIDLDKGLYKIERDEINKSICISDIDNRYKELRIVSHSYDTSYKKDIGQSNGLSYQKFYYPLKNVIPEDFVLQVANIRHGVVYWNDYHYIRDFSLAFEDYRVFELDLLNQMILFGNNENSVVPEKIKTNFNNIRVVRLSYSDGERGNVKGDEIKEFYYKNSDLESVIIKYADAAKSGKSRMNVIDGIKEIAGSRKEIYRAITVSDYEKIAKNTPGLRISYSKALTASDMENKVLVVIVPYTGKNFPMPDEIMMDIVQSNLERYRLITTKVQVVAPKYIGVSLITNISVSLTNKFDVNKLKKSLNEFLTPINGEHVNSSYAIGANINISDIIKIINGFENVNRIDYLRIDGKGEGVKRDNEGNLILPFNGVSYLDNVEINIY